jgi:hypothetical protein
VRTYAETSYPVPGVTGIAPGRLDHRPVEVEPPVDASFSAWPENDPSVAHENVPAPDDA